MTQAFCSVLHLLHTVNTVLQYILEYCFCTPNTDTNKYVRIFPQKSHVHTVHPNQHKVLQTLIYIQRNCCIEFLKKCCTPCSDWPHHFIHITDSRRIQHGQSSQECHQLQYLHIHLSQLTAGVQAFVNLAHTFANSRQKKNILLD